MRIQHNIMAMNAYRNYTTNTSALSKNLEKLSSGYKINRAGDDNENTFDQPKQYFRLLSQALGWNEVGIYCAGGCTGCEKLARQIDKVHLENVYKMGLEL